MNKYRDRSSVQLKPKLSCLLTGSLLYSLFLSFFFYNLFELCNCHMYVHVLISLCYRLLTIGWDGGSSSFAGNRFPGLEMLQIGLSS